MPSCRSVRRRGPVVATGAEPLGDHLAGVLVEHRRRAEERARDGGAQRRPRPGRGGAAGAPRRRSTTTYSRLIDGFRPTLPKARSKVMISSIPRRRQLARWQRSLAPSLGCCSCSWRASVTSACSSGHTSTPALCTADGRKLSRSTSYVVPGPGGGAGELTVSIADASANENDGMIRFTATLARTHRQGEAGLEQGGVDMLAESGPLAGGESGEDANCAVEPGPEVGDRNRDTERRALGGSSAGPLMLITPDMLEAMRSKPPRGAYGPVWPNPEIERSYPRVGFAPRFLDARIWALIASIRRFPVQCDRNPSRWMAQVVRRFG